MAWFPARLLPATLVCVASGDARADSASASRQSAQQRRAKGAGDQTVAQQATTGSGTTATQQRARRTGAQTTAQDGASTATADGSALADQAAPIDTVDQTTETENKRAGRQANVATADADVAAAAVAVQRAAQAAMKGTGPRRARQNATAAASATPAAQANQTTPIQQRTQTPTGIADPPPAAAPPKLDGSRLLD